MNQIIQTHKEKYSDEVKRDIDFFVTKKRRSIMIALYERERLSHGELAEAVNTSPASLSNILLRFEKFEYKLLDSESRGKRRYIFLTDLGSDYIQDEIQQKNTLKINNVISSGTFPRMQAVRESLKEVQNQWDEKWRIKLDDVFVGCKEYSKDQIDRDPGGKIENFLICVEKVLLQDDENDLVELMKVVGAESILADRFEDFQNQFGVYKPLLEIAESECFDDLDLLEFLEIIANGGDREEKVKPFLRMFGWKEKDYCGLRDEIEKVTKYMDGIEKSEIYSYFNKFMAGKRNISAFLAMKIYEVQKSRSREYKEK